MGAVDIGVGHDDHSMVSELLNIEFLAYSGTESGDECPNLRVTEHFVQASFLYVENFTAKRQNRLKVTISPHFGGTTGGVTLNHEQFGFGRITIGTVSQLTRQTGRIECALTTNGFAGLTGSLTSAGGILTFLHNSLGCCRVFAQELQIKLIENLLHDGSRFRGA